MLHVFSLPNITVDTNMLYLMSPASVSPVCPRLSTVGCQQTVSFLGSALPQHIVSLTFYEAEICHFVFLLTGNAYLNYEKC